MTSPQAQDMRDETPADGFGAGYIVHLLREEFHTLCQMIGKESARQEIAEIVNAEFIGRTIDHG